MFIGPIIIWYGPIISLTQNGWWGYDHEIMRPNILIRQLNLLHNIFRFISKFRDHARNLYFKQPKVFLKIKTKTKVKKILAEKWPLIAQIQYSLSKIEMVPTPAPYGVKNIN